MKTKNFFIFTLVVLLFYSCGYEDFDKYTLTIDNSSTANILVVADDIDSISIKFHHKNTIDTLIWYKNWTVIKGYVEQVNYDEKFLLIKQKPLDSICECIHECWNKKTGKGLTWKICENAFEDYDKYLYWIIIVKTDDVYGPFEEEEYLQKCKILGVPSELIKKKKKRRDVILDNINSKP